MPTVKHSFVCLFILNVLVWTSFGQSCGPQTCIYYTALAGQGSQLFSSAGVRFFMNCNCQIYGFILPTPATKTPTPVCGQSQITGSATAYIKRAAARIVGGQNAEECQYPWQVYVRAGGFKCGGTIIDNTHVITAAHCLESGGFKIPANQVAVWAGSSDKLKLTEFKVSQVTRHPNFFPSTFNFDIAVLTLEASFPTNNRCIKPICLPSMSLNIQIGTQCLIIGWGAVAEGGALAQILQEAVIGILDPSECIRAYGANMFGDQKLCAGYTAGRIDACQGDSGGPLICAEGDSWVLAGIVSFGLGCARPGFPGVYTHVSNLKTWVDSNVL